MRGTLHGRKHAMTFTDLQFALGKASQFVGAVEAFVAHQAHTEGEGTSATEAIAADVALRALRIIRLLTSRVDRKETHPHQKAAQDAAVLAVRVAALRSALGEHIRTLGENQGKG